MTASKGGPTWKRRVPPERLAELDRLDEDELFKRLGRAGAKVTKLDAQLNEARDERMQLFVALEERGVSYLRMAKAAGSVSDVAVMRGLERWHDRQPPPKRPLI